MDFRKLSLEDQKRLYERPIPPLPPGYRDPRPRFKEPIMNKDNEDTPQLWPEAVVTFTRDFLTNYRPLESDVCIANERDETWAYDYADVARVEKLFFLNNNWKTKVQAYFWSQPLHIQLCHIANNNNMPGIPKQRHRLADGMRSLAQVNIDSCTTRLERTLAFGTGYFQLRYRYDQYKVLRQMRLLKRYADSLRLGQLGQPLDSVTKQWPSNYLVLFSKLRSLTFGLCFMKLEGQDLMNWLISRNKLTLKQLSMPLRKCRLGAMQYLDLDILRCLIDKRIEKGSFDVLKVKTQKLNLEFCGEYKTKLIDQLLSHKVPFNEDIKHVEITWHGLECDYMRLIERLESLVNYFRTCTPSLKCLRFRDGRFTKLKEDNTSLKEMEESEKSWQRIFHFRNRIRTVLCQKWNTIAKDIEFTVQYEVVFYTFEHSFIGCIDFEIHQDTLILFLSTFDSDGSKHRTCIYPDLNVLDLPEKELKTLILTEIAKHLTPIETPFYGPELPRKTVFYQHSRIKEKGMLVNVSFDPTEKLRNDQNLLDPHHELQPRTFIPSSTTALQNGITHRNAQLEVTEYKRKNRRDRHQPEQLRLPSRTYTNHKFLRRTRIWLSPSLPRDLRNHSLNPQQLDFPLKCLSRPKKRRAPPKKISLP